MGKDQRIKRIGWGLPSWRIEGVSWFFVTAQLFCSPFHWNDVIVTFGSVWQSGDGTHMGKTGVIYGENDDRLWWLKLGGSPTGLSQEQHPLHPIADFVWGPNSLTPWSQTASLEPTVPHFAHFTSDWWNHISWNGNRNPTWVPPNWIMLRKETQRARMNPVAKWDGDRIHPFRWESGQGFNV